MAEHKSVKKRHRQSVRARSRNRTIRGQLRTAVKQVESESNAAAMPALAALLDKAVKRNIVHKNTAARKKSRLMKMLNKKAQAK